MDERTTFAAIIIFGVILWQNLPDHPVFWVLEIGITSVILYYFIKNQVNKKTATRYSEGGRVVKTSSKVTG